MTSLCHFGEASVIVSLLASTLTSNDALPVMYVRRYHHEGGSWRTRYRDMGHTLVSKGAGDCVSRRGDQSGPRAAVAIGRLAPWPPWPRVASCAGLQVSIEPVDQARRDVDLIGASEEKMSLVGVNDELRPYAETPQSVPVFVGLRDRHLRIAIAAYDQNVAQVAVAEVLDVGLRECLALTVAAARIGLEHEVALARKDRIEGIRARREERIMRVRRAAMYLDHKRVAPSLHDRRRFDEHSLNAEAIALPEHVGRLAGDRLHAGVGSGDGLPLAGRPGLHFGR